MNKRKIFKWLGGLALVGVVGVLSMLYYVGFFSSSAYFSTDEGAIRGYDTVAYFEQGQPTKGKLEFTAQWQGADWYFSNANNLALFKQSPEKYAPQYGGYCAYAVAHSHVANTQPDAWEIVDGKLYLNYDQGVRDKWRKDIPLFIEKANDYWPNSKPAMNIK